MTYPLTIAQLEYHDPPRVKIRYLPPSSGDLTAHLMACAMGPQWLLDCTECAGIWSERGPLSSVHDTAHQHATICRQGAPC